MSNTTTSGGAQWLKRYYYGRAAFSMLWVAAALALGRQSAGIAAALLVLYPAWDALANYIDAARSGGLRNSRPQMMNVVASVAAAVGVALALPSMNAVAAVFGAWAIFSGVLQLGAALRRWKHYGAQWAMVLSGAQSALAGAFFIMQSQSPMPPALQNLAGYAGFGAFYFLVSAISLSIGARRASVPVK